MNAIHLKFIGVFILIALIFSCEGKQKSIDTSGNISMKTAKVVTIYGSVNCDHCLEFRKQMGSAKLKYTFKDAEAEEKNYQELLLKIQTANYKGYVSFPVIDI
ncbi:MAG: hypothetical protein KAI29_14975, partial [Cyclobacteriaceae bacterium]|nr:hypothetical protein [Cyclobacteriaceae bacterium]